MGIPESRVSSLVLCGIFSLAACGAGPGTPPRPGPVLDLSPARWESGEIATVRALDASSWDEPPRLAESARGVVATTSFGGTATRAGLEALEQGGSAVDAALVTALTQTVLNLGCWTSFAGLLSLVVYDAESGEVHTLEGGWNSVRGETYPLSPEDTQSRPGRAVLVPGFMAALEAAHRRFGRLPFEQLFAPALYFAEEGVELNGHLAFLIGHRREALTRFKEGRELFLRPDGEVYQRGDRFRQPRLAALLRDVAGQGADVMYRGPWAEKLVATVAAAGGRLSLDDLAAYEVAWRPPVRGRFGRFEIAGLGLPAAGGVEMVEAFRLVELAGLDPAVHYSEDPKALYRMIQITRLAHLFATGTGHDLHRRLFGPLDLSLEGRLRHETTAALWKRLSASDWLPHLRAMLAGGPELSTSEHSDGVVVADERGNVVALFHSINGSPWGSAIFAGGVSLTDAGANPRTARTPAGGRLPYSGRPFLALAGAEPVAASSSIGRGVHGKAVQNMVNVLHYGMDPRQSLQAAQFFTPEYERDAEGKLAIDRQRIPEGVFSDEVLAKLHAMGQQTVPRPANDRLAVGYWVGLALDPESGVARASASSGGYAAGRQALK